MLITPGSLSRKIIGTLLFFFLFSLLAIAMTLAISWQLEGVAAAINDAGSERMRSYRIGHLMARVSDDKAGNDQAAALLRNEIKRFDEVLGNLQNGDPQRPMAPPRDAEVRQHLLAVEASWRLSVRPLAESFVSASASEQRLISERYDDELNGFVSRINELVLAMEKNYATNTNLLRTVQLMLIILVLFGAVMLINFFNQLVIRPVQVLHSGMRRMTDKDLSVRLPVNSNDELGSLAKGFNQMAEHLQIAYSTLEERVEVKTRSLEERNRELGMLYEVTALLSEPAPIEILCETFLQSIRQSLGADAGAVRLYSPETEVLYLIAHDGLSEDFLKTEAAMNCGDCVCGELVQGGMPVAFSTVNPPIGMKLFTCVREGFATASAFNIRYDKQRLGVFNLYFNNQHQLTESEIQLLETLGQHLGVAIDNQRLKSREKELAVSEERNLLAQELHDSIAQGLAFLNIQVQLLQDSLRKGRSDEAMQTAGQLREGVQESYDDVRELLVHFRTRVHQSDLDTAIRSALAKFEGQTSINTEFKRVGEGAPLQPTDEIQVMHIVQESLSNVRKHAQASLVTVTVYRGMGQLVVEVVDNGQGFDTANDPRVLSERHVGLKIMRERAHRVGGECLISSAPGEGTKVVLNLPKLQKKAA
ncbi:MAG: type IV pili methyl-accepting chemotaxis transducer N-terminal domain-containing protein [Rhodocyclaceae bacterium]|nr:type IV pili methyl-accepting chemotaxis transducer N-terminal domain-containing protein [Rhodocyclaceae bacterium]